MAVRLLLAPAASGKTSACIDRVRDVLATAPLADVWVLVPNRTQVQAFRCRLAERGGALGVRVGTFGDLYATLLARAGRQLPEAPAPVIHRLVLAAIDAVAERGQLLHYASIRCRPGFVRALSDLMAELKRGRIETPEFATAVVGMGRRLDELALLYGEYQAALIRLGWADAEGLGWLAANALEADTRLARGWRLVVVDGFDSFTTTQLKSLALLDERVDELVLTLSGDLTMSRRVYRRFERTLERVRAVLATEELPHVPHPNRVAALAHLQAGLYTPNPVRHDPAGHLAMIEAQTPALEAREALRWIKARVRRDGVRIDQCAILARDLAPYRAFLRETGSEFGIPLRFAGGEPLMANPAVAAILNLVELPLIGWARRPLLDALRTPYLDLSTVGLERRDAARLKQVAYWAQVIKGEDQWEEAMARLATPRGPELAADRDDEVRWGELPRGDEARSLWEHLKALFARTTPPAAAGLRARVRWLQDLLSDDIGLKVSSQVQAQSGTALRDQAALAQFNKVLQSLVLGEQIVGEREALTWAQFVQELRGAVEAAEYEPDELHSNAAGAAFVASLAAARGVVYRAVVLLGLSEGIFPAPLDEDPFLSDEERQALNAQGLPLEPRLRSDQQTLFYEAVTRATDYLLLTRPYLADDGEAWVPSPFWTEVQSLYEIEPEHRAAGPVRHPSQSGSVVELLATAVRRGKLPRDYTGFETERDNLHLAAHVLQARLAQTPQSEYEGRLEALARTLGTRYAAAHVWSASRIETYAACPFRFLVASALDLEPRETPVAGFDPSQLGSMLHSILERVYVRVADPTDIEAIIAVLPPTAAEVFECAPEQMEFRPTPLWNSEKVELVEKLETSLRLLAELAAGFRPVRYEAGFGFKGEPPLTVDTAIGEVCIHGVIDRVDVDADGQVRVIDYKTGTRHLDARALTDGLRMQLPLYSLAAQQRLHLGRVVDGFYWSILQAKAGTLRLARFYYAPDADHEYRGVTGAIDLMREHLERVVSGVRSGHFAPSPLHGECPDFCAAKSICWRYQPSDA